MTVRSLVLWFPDWPVTALHRTGDDAVAELAEHAPIAILHANTVVACSPAARAEGVRRGQRRRDAQSRCPTLTIVPEDPGRDSRAFLPVLDVIEELAPGVQVIRPGLCALRARGPARYYGGEEEAVAALRAALAAAGLDDVRAGVADGPFTAEHAARVATEGVRVVPPGESAAFLAPLSIAALGDAELVGLLSRLGVRTLGEFAALDAERVQGRFGERGQQLYALAAGRDSSEVVPRVAPVELERIVAFEPPLELAEQIAFGVRQTCDEVLAVLGEQHLVCTELRIELIDDRGGRSERLWLHPTYFSAAEMVDRVRWQLEAALVPPGPDGAPGEPAPGRLSSAVTTARICPETVAEARHHALGLFGQGPGERVHHALSRVQAMLGHRGVLVPVLGGGRWLGEREVHVPWGDRMPAAQALHERPWPGHLVDPLPTTVFPDPIALQVRDASGQPVQVDDRGTLSASPASLAGPGIRAAIREWAGPWPIHEREWDAARRRVAHRFQLVDADGGAWLAVLEDGRWFAEGRYD